MKGSDGPIGPTPVRERVNLSAMDTVLLVSCNKIQFFPFLKAKKSIR